VLPPDLAAGVSVERFRREIMLAAGLNHPNIVPVLRSGEIAGLPYFLMPFIKGESLRGRLARGPLSVRETTSILKDVARALAYAHERGIVHRDIKPDNILLTGDAATVTDFGVAKAITASRKAGVPERPASVTGEGISLGTPTYMGPEQAVADPNLTGAADIYSLGVVGYEMLVGAPPFEGRSAAAVLAAHVRETPPPIASRRYDVPRPLVTLIMQCLEKDPARRPRSGATLARELEGAGASGGQPAVTERGARRRQRRAIAAVAGVLLLAGPIAWWWSARPRPAPVPVAAARPARGAVAVAIRPTSDSDPREAAVSRALAAQLTTALSALPGYRVASTAAALGPRPIGVDFMLEGSVQRERNVVRVNLRLVDASRDSTMWAMQGQGATDSLFALQDSLTRAAVAVLAGALR
jgi:eukaryotic-like serine/threonine-protein kinase